VALNPGTRFGHGQAGARIGIGGMREVSRAADVMLNRDMAIEGAIESRAGRMVSSGLMCPISLISLMTPER
jgi:hypothetical protein